jgi:Domain of unknown function (DUF4397)
VVTVHRQGKVRAGIAAVLLAGVGCAGIAGPAQAVRGTGQVFVLHGIAGETLDVFVDNTGISRAATPKTIVGPLRLGAGEHTVELRKGSTVVAEASFTVTAGSSTDLVAHRFPDAGRAPSLTAFSNDLSPVAPGKARLLIAHTAVVPPADVLVNGSALVRNVANGESATNIVPGGSYQVAIVPTFTTGPAVLGPKTLRIHAGTLTSVFAIGDPVAGTMDAIVQELAVPVRGARVPGQVNTGDGGQAAGLFDSPQLPASAGTGGTGSIGGTGAGVTAAALLLGGTALLATRARRRLAGPSPVPRGRAPR